MNNAFKTKFSGGTVKLEENIDIKTETIDSDVEFCDSDRKEPASTDLHCVKCHSELESSGFMRNAGDLLLNFMCYECFDGSVPLSRVGSKATLHPKQTKEKLKNFTCKQCDTAFLGRRAFKEHVNISHKKNTIYFICRECHRGFSTEKRLNSHEENKHKKINNYFCRLCNRGYILEKFFKNHVERAHKEAFICGDCDRAFTHKDRMRNHIQRVHMTTRYPCEDCDRSFTKISTLETHTSVRHPKIAKAAVKPFACQVCGHSFKDQHSLTLHEDRVHKRAWKYICVECDRAFPYEYHLTMHVNTIHRRLATHQHVCEMCKSAFLTKEYLKTHIRVKHASVI